MPDIVVCAHNEAARIEPVLMAIKAANVGHIITVSDRCSDQTPLIAARYGDVIHVPFGDKGSAMQAGLDWVESDAVLFLDADLIGLQPGHVKALALMPPASGQLVGLTQWFWGVTAGRVFGWLPSISGQRRLPTDFARSIGLAGTGYEAETRINVAVAKAGLPHRQIILRGVRNPTSVLGSPGQWLAKMTDVVRANLRYAPELAHYVRQ